MPQIQGVYAEAGALHYMSQAPEAPKTVKASPGLLYGFLVVNTKATDVFLFVFDSAAASGTLLFPPIKITKDGGYASLRLTAAVAFFTGLTFASSSTVAAYTSTATSDLYIRAHLK